MGLKQKSDSLLSVGQLGQKIKAKFPNYSFVEDTDLGLKFLKKYPDYQQALNPEGISLYKKYMSKEGLATAKVPQMQPQPEQPELETSLGQGVKSTIISSRGDVQHLYGSTIEEISGERKREDIYSRYLAGEPIFSDDAKAYDSNVSIIQKDINALDKQNRHLNKQAVSLMMEARRKVLPIARMDVADSQFDENALKDWEQKPEYDQYVGRKTELLNELSDYKKARKLFKKAGSGQGAIDMVQKAYEEESYAEEQMRKGTELSATAPQGEGFWFNAGAMLPQIALSFVAIASAPFVQGTSLALLPGILGAMNVGMIAGVSFAGGLAEIDRYTEETGMEISPLERWGISAMAGIIEYSTERIRLGRYMPKGMTAKAITKALLKDGKGIGTRLMREYAQSASPKIARIIHRAGQGFFEEGSEEFVAGGLQEFRERIYKDPEHWTRGKELAEELAQAFAGGALMGTALGSVNFWATNKMTSDRRKKTGQVVLAEDVEAGKVIEVVSQDKEGDVIGYTAKGKSYTISKDNLGASISMTLDQFDNYMDAKKGNKEVSAQIEKDVQSVDQDRQVDAIVEELRHSDGKNIIRIMDDENNSWYVKDGEIDQSGVDVKTPLSVINTERETLSLDPGKIRQTEVIPVDQWRTTVRAELGFFEQEAVVEKEAEKVPVPEGLPEAIMIGAKVTVAGVPGEIMNIEDPTEGIGVRFLDEEGNEYTKVIVPEEYGSLQVEKQEEPEEQPLEEGETKSISFREGGRDRKVKLIKNEDDSFTIDQVFTDEGSAKRMRTQIKKQYDKLSFVIEDIGDKEDPWAKNKYIIKISDKKPAPVTAEKSTITEGKGSPADIKKAEAEIERRRKNTIEASSKSETTIGKINIHYDKELAKLRGEPIIKETPVEIKDPQDKVVKTDDEDDKQSKRDAELLSLLSEEDQEMSTKITDIGKRGRWIKNKARRVEGGNQLINKHRAEDVLENSASTIEERVTAKIVKEKGTDFDVEQGDVTRIINEIKSGNTWGYSYGEKSKIKKYYDKELAKLRGEEVLDTDSQEVIDIKTMSGESEEKTKIKQDFDNEFGEKTPVSDAETEFTEPKPQTDDELKSEEPTDKTILAYQGSTTAELIKSLDKKIEINEAGTGTLYIKYKNTKIRISDHEPNIGAERIRGKSDFEIYTKDLSGNIINSKYDILEKVADYLKLEIKGQTEVIMNKHLDDQFKESEELSKIQIRNKVEMTDIKDKEQLFHSEIIKLIEGKSKELEKLFSESEKYGNLGSNVRKVRSRRTSYFKREFKKQFGILATPGDVKNAIKQNIKPKIKKDIKTKLSGDQIKDKPTDDDGWRDTRIQAKNIFRMLKEKHNNNIPDMKAGLEDVLKQNNTKKDQADVMWEEFNKYFKIEKDVKDKPSPPSYGSKNKIVSNTRYEELKKKMKDKLGGQLTSGVDPELFAIGAEMAIYHIEAGGKKFTDFSKRMINDLGNGVKKYLKAFYEGARRMPDVDNKDMDDTNFVDNFDFDSLTKEQPKNEKEVNHLVNQKSKKKEFDLKTDLFEEPTDEKLLSIIAKYNELRSWNKAEMKEKGRLMNKILKGAKQLGIDLEGIKDYSSKIIAFRDGKKIRRKSLTTPTFEVYNYVPLSERSQEVKDLFNLINEAFIKNPEILNKTRVGVEKKDIKGAIKDILANINSQRAQNFLKTIDIAIGDDYISVFERVGYQSRDEQYPLNEFKDLLSEVINREEIETEGEISPELIKKLDENFINLKNIDQEKEKDFLTPEEFEQVKKYLENQQTLLYGPVTEETEKKKEEIDYVERTTRPTEQDSERKKSEILADEGGISGPGGISGRFGERKGITDNGPSEKGESKEPRKSGDSDLGDTSIASGKRGDKEIHKEEPGSIPAPDLSGGGKSGPGDGTGKKGPTISYAGDLFGDQGYIRETSIQPQTDQAKKQDQVNKQNIVIKTGNLDNIKETLPALYPDQQTDVQKAENRFFTQKGKGYLFTNATGTGKTYTGLGILKRFYDQGFKEILVVVPSDTKAKDWIEDGNILGIPMTQLKNTKDAGSGINTTTYHNFYQNKTLEDREFDLIIYDESHSIMGNQKGSQNNRTIAHLRNSNREDHALQKLKDHNELWQKESKLVKEIRDYRTEIQELEQEERKNSLRNIFVTANVKERRRNEVTGLESKIEAVNKVLVTIREEQKKVLPGMEEKAKSLADKTKVVFLSATPFKTHFTLRYADGYLFDMGSGSRMGKAYNAGSTEDNFFISNFGYQMKYNKLTIPNVDVDVSLLERKFIDGLVQKGVMSGRMLMIDKDYSREFPIIAGKESDILNQGMKELTNNEDRKKYENLSKYARYKFYNHLYSNQLFEILKASYIKERVDKHLAMGRQVLIFHKYVNSVVSHPFDFDNAYYEYNDWQTKQRVRVNIRDDKKALEELVGFKRENAHLTKLNFDLRNPITQLSEYYGNRLVQFNGTITNKKIRRNNIKQFNTIGSGVDIILVQEMAGREGIDLHDNNNGKPRVSINLALPFDPITALQTEGRTNRIGQTSNTTIEYPILGLDIEQYQFGSRINKRVGTTENLALGSMARDLRRSFKDGYLNSAIYDPHDEQGQGGKEFDRSMQEDTPSQQARAFYFTNKKKTSRDKSREGINYFATPEPLGLKMVEWLNLKSGEEMLEPSAGHGAIARFVPEAVKLTAIEPSFSLFSKLSINTKGDLSNGMFEDHNIINKYEGIAMNPPFGSGGKTAMEHIEKAFVHLRNGGRIVAIVPNGPSMQKRLDKFLYGENEKGKLVHPDVHLIAEINLPGVTFERAGTKVNTKVIVLDKISDTKDIDMPLKREYSLSDITKINDFFDEIENVSIPDRVTIPEAEQKEVTKSPLVTGGRGTLLPKTAEEGGTVSVLMQKNTKTGADMPTVIINDYVDRDDFLRMKSHAKRIDSSSYYSRYRGRGIKKGFIFSSIKKAQEFKELIDNLYSSEDNVSLSVSGIDDKIKQIDKKLKSLKAEKQKLKSSMEGRKVTQTGIAFPGDIVTTPKITGGDLFDAPLQFDEKTIKSALQDIEGSMKVLQKERLRLEKRKTTEDPGDQGVLFNIKDTFYSNTERALQQISQKKATAKQWKAMLQKKGAKKAEMDWMELDEFFENNPKPTKEELQNFIQNNKIELEETVLVEPKELINQTRIKTIHTNKYDEAGEEILGYALVYRDSGEKFDDEVFDTKDELRKHYDFIDETTAFEDQEGPGIAKYKKWTLEGGKKYKEILIQLPATTDDILPLQKPIRIDDSIMWGIDFKNYNKDIASTLSTSNEFEIDYVSAYHEGGYIGHQKNGNYVYVDENNHIHSDTSLAFAEDLLKKDLGIGRTIKNPFTTRHWSEHENVIVHARIAEHKDTDGEKVLVVEEIQGDWAQKGRKTGFKLNEKEQKIVKLIETDFQWIAITNTGKRHPAGKGIWSDTKFDKTGKAIFPTPPTEEMAREYLQHIVDEDNRFNKDIDDSKVPNMPFKKTDQWMGLAFKRVLRYAVENGYDKVAWTPGEIQKERFDLSKQVNELHIKNSSYGYSIYADGNSIINGLAEEKLEDYVGKELAKRIIEDNKTTDHKKLKKLLTEDKEYQRLTKIAKEANEIIDSGKYKSLFDAQALRDKAESNALDHFKKMNYGQYQYQDKKYSGVDLEIGGEGMVAFYDKHLVNWVNKFGKKFGAKVGKTTIIEREDAKTPDHIEWSEPENVSEDTFETFSENKKYRITFGSDGNSVVYIKDDGLEGKYLPVEELFTSVPLAKAKAYELFKKEYGEVKTDLHSIAITPQMKEAVERGLPLYKKSEKKYPGDLITSPAEMLSDLEKTKIEIEQKTELAFRDASRELIEEFENTLGVPINAVNKPGELPSNISSKLFEYGVTDETKGVFVKKDASVYVIIDNHSSISELGRTILHEVVGHKGLREMLGWRLDNMLIQVYNSMKQFSIDNTAKKYNFIVNDKTKKHKEQDKIRIAEEYLSEIASNDVKPSFVKKFVAKIRMLLRKYFPNIKWTTNDIYSLLARSKQFIQNKYKKGKIPSVPKYKFAGTMFNKKSDVFEEQKIDIVDIGSSPDIIPGEDALSLSVKPKESPFAGDILKIQQSLAKQTTQEKKVRKLLNTRGDKFREFIQDKMLSIRTLMDIVKERGGKIDAFSNPYMMENLSQSKSDVEIENFVNDNWKPLIESISKITTETSLSYDDLLEYIWVKHVPERNELLEKKLKVKWGGGMATDKAEKLIEKWENIIGKARVKELWGKINAATDFTLKRWLDDGFISKEEYAEYKSGYDYYVPLRGWAGEKADDIFDYLNSDVGGAFNPNIKAWGRSSKPDDPFVYIRSMAETAVVAGNKNKVKQQMLNLVRNNSQMKDLFSFQKFWLVQNTEGEWIETLSKPDQKLFDDGRVRTKMNNAHEKRNTLKNSEQHLVTVFENGEKYMLVMNDPGAGRAINNLNVWEQDLTRVFQNSIGRATRHLSKVFTSRNPAFIPVNWMRDISYASMSQAIKEDGDVKKFLSNVPSARRAIHRHLSGKSKLKTNELDKMYNNWRSHGGETGYVHLNKTDKFKRELNRDLRRMKGENSWTDKVGQNRVLKKAGQALEYMALMSENMARFAVYMTAIENGMSKSEAAYESKNATVNFNRKGRISGLAGSLYAFFNAQVQGAQNILGLAKNNPKPFIKAGASFVVMGALVSELARALSPPDEDGKNAYDKLPDWIKHNFLVIPNFFSESSDKFLTIPLPHGFRALYGLGVTITDVLHKKKTLDGAMFSIASDIIDAVSPWQFPATALRSEEISTIKALRPTIPSAIVPWYDIWINENFAGRKIFKESFTKDLERWTPRSEQGLYNVNDALRIATRSLNRIGGGDQLRPANIVLDPETGDIKIVGWKKAVFDHNPSKIEHVIEYYLGGLGKFWNNVYKTSKSTVKIAMGDEEETLSSYNLPVVRRFVSSPYKRDLYGEYYTILREVKDFKHYESAFRNNDDINMVKIMYGNRYMQELKAVTTAYKGMLDVISEAIDMSTDSDKILTLRARRNDMMKDLVTRYNKIKLKYGKDETN